MSNRDAWRPYVPKTPVRVFDPRLNRYRMVADVPVERRFLARTEEGVIWQYRLADAAKDPR